MSAMKHPRRWWLFITIVSAVWTVGMAFCAWKLHIIPQFALILFAGAALTVYTAVRTYQGRA